MSQTKPICLHRIVRPTEDNSCETEDNSPGGGLARGAAREPCEADGSRDHGEAMTLSLAGIGVHGGCRQCTRGLGACGVVWCLSSCSGDAAAAVRSRSTLAAANATSGWSRLDKFSIDSGCAWCREIQFWNVCTCCVRLVWIALSSGAGGSTGGAFLGFGTTSGFMGKAIWTFVYVACITCGCLAASDAAAWPHARSGSAPNFAYEICVCMY